MQNKKFGELQEIQGRLLDFRGTAFHFLNEPVLITLKVPALFSKKQFNLKTAVATWIEV